MKRKSLRFRLYAMLAGFLFLSVLLISFIVCYISYQNVIDQSVLICNQMVDKTTEEVNRLLDKMSTIPETIGRDARMQNAMRMEPLGMSEREVFSAEYEIKTFLLEMNRYAEDIFCMYFFAENGILAQSKYYRLTMEELQSNILYQEACARETAVWYPPRSGSYVSVTAGERLITVAAPVKEIGSGDYAGMVVMEMEEKKIAEHLSTGIGKNGFLYICDADGEPIICPDGKESEGIGVIDPEDAGDGLVIRRRLDCGWYLIGIVPRSDLTQAVWRIIVTTALVCALLLAVALAVIVRITEHILQPIAKLNEKMSQVGSGDLTVRMEISRYDEIGMLIEHFNEMVRQVDVLMQREVENQKQLRLVEFKALQAQIKPHFLYNTLDSIIWMARVNNQDGVVHMLLALTNFLKTGLSRGGEIIPLEQEIRHCSSYLYIQETRYKGNFVYTVTLDEKVRHCPVPKMIIQPLAENAIYHGMKLKYEMCRLEIRAYERDGQVVIDVLDDGAGMDPKTAQVLRESLENHETDVQRDGYGVSNVNERIRIMYGPAFGITFETRLGEGSAFHITLPKDGKRKL